VVVMGHSAGGYNAAMVALDRRWLDGAGLPPQRKLAGWIGLAVVGVPLVVPLAALVFLGAFVPIIGAVVTGGVAVLVAVFQAAGGSLTPGGYDTGLRAAILTGAAVVAAGAIATRWLPRARAT